MSWYNMSTDGTFGMDIMAERAKNRFHESIETNPNFYYGPVTGLIARNAGYIFSGRLFRNHSRSEEHTSELQSSGESRMPSSA